jgi:hypothetical protein
VKRTDDLLTRAIVNNVTYIPQTVPTLYTALSAGANAMNPIVYGVNSNSFVLKYGEVVEIVLINNDGGDHPWQYAECQTFIMRDFTNIRSACMDTISKSSAVLPQTRPTIQRSIQSQILLSAAIQYRSWQEDTSSSAS